MRRCCTCKQEKQNSDFNKKGKGLNYKCRDCHKQYLKNHYAVNKDQRLTEVKLRRAEMNTWFNDMKENMCCKMCGASHIAILDFHHRDPTQKKFCVAYGVHFGYGKETVLKEIAKCDILCSNCHRIMHWNERKNNKELLELNEMTS